MSTSIKDHIPDCPLMTIAWMGSVSYAWGEPSIMEAFKRESGMEWVPPKNALERMIDEATGHEEAFIKAFLKWHNETIWGTDAEAGFTKKS